ncbi:MAG: peptidase [Candidatus Omnitrophica bacterium]|nr:peptidase [Candidatus Omnitrophota bacterium]
MTYCVGIKVKDGLIGLADTRMTAGNQTLTARKVTIEQKHGEHAVFLMTSGLRALRDKAVTYFQEIIEESGFEYKKMYKLVNAFGGQIRRVAQEDREALRMGNYNFNIHGLIAGQLEEDKEHKLFMIFPEGNWVEVGEANPYFIIGNTNNGKPILDRVLRYESSMDFALKVSFLSFNATQVSSNDVDYPVDIILYRKDSFTMAEQRLTRQQMAKYTNWWQSHLGKLIEEFPDDWAREILEHYQQEQQQQ